MRPVCLHVAQSLLIESVLCPSLPHQPGSQVPPQHRTVLTSQGLPRRQNEVGAGHKGKSVTRNWLTQLWRLRSLPAQHLQGTQPGGPVVSSCLRAEEPQSEGRGGGGYEPQPRQ